MLTRPADAAIIAMAGIGLEPCKQALATADDTAQGFAWVQGAMSSLNMRNLELPSRLINLLPAAFPEAAQKDFFIAWCGEHPEEIVYAAGGALWYKLNDLREGERRTEVRVKKPR